MALRHFATAGGVAILSERLVRSMRDARIGVLAAALLAACGDQKSPSQVTAPGESASASTRVLEAGATVLQDRPPIESLTLSHLAVDGDAALYGRWTRVLIARPS